MILRSNTRYNDGSSIRVDLELDDVNEADWQILEWHWRSGVPIGLWGVPFLIDKLNLEIEHINATTLAGPTEHIPLRRSVHVSGEETPGPSGP